VVTFRVVVQGFRIWRCLCKGLRVFFHGLRFKDLKLGFRVLVLGCSVFLVTFRVVVQGFRIK
jgi:hypothetical protein